ncbi:MAG: hypothetical protein ACRCZ6_17730 [Kluyvera sp.]|uniref:hypothetical protein n=1 Tax=Kluyvera sp. TaxID=1538228 RepID=UPI003F2EF575
MNNITSRPISTSSVYERKHTLEILSESEAVSRERVKQLKQDIAEAKKSTASSADIKALENTLRLANDDLVIRRNIMANCYKDRGFYKPYYHFYKNHPDCSDIERRELSGKKMLIKLHGERSDEHRLEYRQAIASIPITYPALVEAYKPGVFFRVMNKLCPEKI